jgi:mRNA interferase RelE/StbE
MPEYAVQVARPAEKEIEDLPSSVLQRLRQKLDGLASNPRPTGCIKLQGARNRWRVRVGDYRIVYTVDDPRKIVDVVGVRHRRDVYR